MVTLAAPQDVPSPAPAGLLERMELWLSSAYGDVGCWTFDVVKDTVGSGRNGVRIYHAIDRRRGIRVALKAHSSRWRNLAEFRALTRMHAVTPDSVRPLYIAAGWRFYAMEWVDAPSVETWLQAAQRQTVLHHAGAWLSHLHAAGAGKPFHRRSYPRLRLTFRDDVPAEVIAAARLRERRQSLSPRAAPLALLHDDFHPANLAFDGTRIIAMDRKRDVYGVPYFDVAKFLVALEIAAAEALARGDRAPRDATADRRSFLAGYGPLPQGDRPHLDLFEDILVFRAWRHRRHAGDHSLDPLMHRRGLLDADATAAA